MEFYIDEIGSKRIKVNLKYELLASYLESDTQTPEGCQIVLDYIKEIEGNLKTEISTTGNAHYIKIMDNTVLIECLWDESLGTLELSIFDFKEALIKWQTYLIQTS